MCVGGGGHMSNTDPQTDINSEVWNEASVVEGIRKFHVTLCSDFRHSHSILHGRAALHGVGHIMEEGLQD